MSQGEVVHIVRNYGVVSEMWIPESIRAVARLGWSPWILPTGRVMKGAEDLFPGRERWLAPEPAGRVRWARDLARLRTRADRNSAALVRPLARVRPALAHAHFGWTAAEARQAAVEGGVPLVVTFHGSDLTVFPGRRRAWDYRRLFRSAASVIAVSEFLAERLRDYGFRGRAHVIPMGIDLEKLPFREPLPPPEGPRVLFVGRLETFKGADVLMHAIPLVRARIPDVRFEIVGDGALRDECSSLRRSLGLDGAVRLRGALPRAEVYAALQQADVVVIPSRQGADGRVEGRNVVAMEAMAVGAPIVATRSGGLPETVPPEQRAELAEPGDSESLAAALVARLAAPESWPERAAVGRRWVEANFAWPQIAERIATVYSDAAQR